MFTCGHAHRANPRRSDEGPEPLQAVLVAHTQYVRSREDEGGRRMTGVHGSVAARARLGRDAIHGVEDRAFSIESRLGQAGQTVVPRGRLNGSRQVFAPVWQSGQLVPCGRQQAESGYGAGVVPRRTHGRNRPAIEGGKRGRITRRTCRRPLVYVEDVWNERQGHTADS